MFKKSMWLCNTGSDLLWSLPLQKGGLWGRWPQDERSGQGSGSLVAAGRLRPPLHEPITDDSLGSRTSREMTCFTDTNRCTFKPFDSPQRLSGTRWNHRSQTHQRAGDKEVVKFRHDVDAWWIVFIFFPAKRHTVSSTLYILRRTQSRRFSSDSVQFIRKHPLFLTLGFFFFLQSEQYLKKRKCGKNGSVAWSEW